MIEEGLGMLRNALGLLSQGELLPHLLFEDSGTNNAVSSNSGSSHIYCVVDM